MAFAVADFEYLRDNGVGTQVEVSADFWVGGDFVASTLERDPAVEFAGALTLVATAAGPGEAGWSGTGVFAVKTELFQVPHGPFDTMADGRVQLFATLRQGSNLTRIPIGFPTVIAAFQRSKSTAVGAGWTLVDVSFADQLQSLGSNVIPSYSAVGGSGAVYGEGAGACPPECLAYLVASEGNANMPTASIGAAPLDGVVFDVQAPMPSFAGQSYIDAVLSTVEPFGLIGRVDRGGEFEVVYPCPSVQPAMQFTDEDVLTADTSFDGIDFNGVETTANSADETEEPVTIYGFHAGGDAAPLHVDPSDIVHSALTPAVIRRIDLVGDAVNAAAAVEMNGHRIGHPENITVALKRAAILEPQQVVYLDIEGFTAGRYLLSAVTQTFTPSMKTVFSARRMAHSI